MVDNLDKVLGKIKEIISIEILDDTKTLINKTQMIVCQKILL